MSTAPTLPAAADWFGSPAWRDHLTGDHYDTPDPSCPSCHVAPLMAEIHAAWRTADQATAEALWALQDGYGEPGFTPEQGFDWSGIRDSSPAATYAMWAALQGVAR